MMDFNAGAFGLPQAGGGPFSDHGGPSLGIPPLDATLQNREVPIIDEPFPPRQLDVDNPIMVFKEVGDSKPTAVAKQEPDESASAEIKSTCGNLGWSDYLSAKYGGLGVLIMLFLCYAIGVCCYVHAKYVNSAQNEGEREEL